MTITATTRADARTGETTMTHLQREAAMETEKHPHVPPDFSSDCHSLDDLQVCPCDDCWPVFAIEMAREIGREPWEIGKEKKANE